MTKKNSHAMRTPDAVAAEHAAKLPKGRRARLQAAADALRVFDDSIRIENASGAQLMGEIYDAVIWLLNGRTFDGTRADADSAGNVVMAECAAPPGEVPGWGRAGSFLLEVDRLRLRVEVEPWGCGLEKMISVGFHAVDLTGPFISPTGYRQEFFRASRHLGKSLPQALAAFVRNQKRVPIEPERLDTLAADVPAWLADLPSLGDAPCCDAEGQMIMGFTLQAEPRAPKTAAERQADHRRRRKAAQQAGELVILELSAEEADFIGGAVCTYASGNEHRAEAREVADSLWRRVRIARSGGRYSPADPKWSREAVQADAKAVREKLAVLWEGATPAADGLQLGEADRAMLCRALDLLNEYQQPEGEAAAEQLALLRKLSPGAEWRPANARLLAGIHRRAEAATKHAQSEQRAAERKAREWQARAEAAERALRAIGAEQVDGQWQGVEQLPEDMAALLAERGPVVACLGVLQRMREVGRIADHDMQRATDARREADRLRSEKELLEQERNGAMAALKLFEQRLRDAGLSADYRG